MEPAPQRRPRLVEEPRRTPWPLIIAAVLIAVLIAWAVKNLRFDLPDFGSRTWSDHTEEVVLIEPTAPAAPVAQPMPTTDGVRPRWVRQPAPDYPVEAYDVPEASVRLICTIAADKGLENCLVIEETPAGRGFGRSAVASMREARVSADSPTGDRVDFRIRYVLPD